MPETGQEQFPLVARDEVFGLGSRIITGTEKAEWGDLPALLTVESAKLRQSDKPDSQHPSGSSTMLCQSGKLWKQVPIYCSWKPHPEALSIDAFLISWQNKSAYCTMAEQ